MYNLKHFRCLPGSFSCSFRQCNLLFASLLTLYRTNRQVSPQVSGTMPSSPSGAVPPWCLLCSTCYSYGYIKAWSAFLNLTLPVPFDCKQHTIIHQDGGTHWFLWLLQKARKRFLPQYDWDSECLLIGCKRVSSQEIFGRSQDLLYLSPLMASTIFPFYFLPHTFLSRQGFSV